MVGIFPCCPRRTRLSSLTASAEDSQKKDNKQLAASIGRSTLFGVLGSIVQVSTRIITVPLVISHLGLGGYGIWNIIMNTANYMRFGSVGVKTAFQKYVAEATGNGDYDTANKLLSTGFILMLILSVVGLIPLALYAHQIAKFVGVPPEFIQASAGALSLLALIMVMSNVGATYEAIVMGGHRVDLTRKFGTVLVVAEAVFIVLALHLGYGLVAMAAVMGGSELIYIVLCYFMANRVLPQIHVRWSNFTTSVIYELARFAGSYQVLNLLEVLYASILPFAILRYFGANEAGVYAVVGRVVISASILQDAFLPPILSGGAMIFASGSSERLRSLFVKAFKVTLALSLLPLGFICIFGPLMAYAWTGESDPTFRTAFWIVCLTYLFRSVSLLALVLYRTSGRAILDNIRQVLRIVIILCVVLIAPKFGFQAVLAGLALAEFVGMVFMLFSLSKTFDVFKIGSLIPDVVRLCVASALILLSGFLASKIPFQTHVASRLAATLQLVQISIGCALVAWPVLVLTGAVTKSESIALLGSFFNRRETGRNDAS
jgi:O-antigen/teichoic acid export membrane protein